MIPRLSFWSGLMPLLLLALLGPVAGRAVADTGHPAARALAQRTAQAAAAAQEDANEGRVIVQYRRGAALLAASPRQPLHAAALGRRIALPLTDGRPLGERMQSLRGKGMSSSALAARLAAQPDVEWAVVDGRKGINAVPNDPYFGANQTSVTPVVGQWFLRAPDATIVSATHAVGAWDITTGSASVTVAVLDTGVRFDHPDLAGKLHPGYDFVRASIEADGSNGADPDASDPGDWVSTCGTSNTRSSWHGTQVAGLIGAATDNGIGVAGLGRNVMVLPVRVLGQCGSGYDSDIIAGMRWAAGLSNDGSCTSTSTRSATCNPNPARVINMSLGGSGSCSPSYQAVVTELVNAGVVLVVASGNDAGHAVNSPANCTGAIAVAGVRHAGTKVGYSNVGPQMTIAAPAGNCINVAAGSECLYPLMTTVNLGTTAPGANGYSDSYIRPSLGTSFATPLVAGTVALMRSLAPAMTPAQIKTALQASARAFPTTGGTDATVTTCHAPDGQDQLECYCTTSTCGAGMLDTAAAVALAAGVQPPLAAVFAISTVQGKPGDTVVLDGAVSSRSATGFAWRVADSGVLRLSGGQQSAATQLNLLAEGTTTVSLTVSDAAGNTRTTSRFVQVITPPTVSISPAATSETVGRSITLSSVATAFFGRTISSYSWTVSGADSTLSRTDQSTTVLTLGAPGSVVATLTVTDSAGVTGSQSVTISAIAPPTPRVIATPSTPAVGQTVTLSASTSSASGNRTIAGYSWTLVSGGAIAAFSGPTNGESATLTTSGTGTVTLRLTVTDSAGATGSVNQSLEVGSVSPSQGGGGGALGLGWLAGLAAAVLALGRRPQKVQAAARG